MKPLTIAAPLRRLSLALISAGVLAGALSACAPAVLGGAALGVTMVSDRRTSGTLIEDEGIELKGASRIRDALADRGHINVTSYNRQVLLTGEASSEADKQTAAQVASRVENVRSVINELGVMPNTTLGQRSSDSLVTGRIKASFIDASDLSANAFKVVTERNVVYLMGRVTAREAERATQIARTAPGVQRVVRSLELISEEELARSQPAPRQGASAPR